MCDEAIIKESGRGCKERGESHSLLKCKSKFHFGGVNAEFRLAGSVHLLFGACVFNLKIINAIYLYLNP